MKKLSLLLMAIVLTACNRQKELSDAEKSAELAKDKMDNAERVAKGKDAEARQDLIEKAKSGK